MESDTLNVREILRDIPCWSAKQSKDFLGLDDLLVLFSKCEDENDGETPLYIYCTPNYDVLNLAFEGENVVCPTCHNSSMTSPHQYKYRDIDDIPMRCHRTILRVLYSTFRCKTYQTLAFGRKIYEKDGCPTFQADLKCAEKRARLTIRLDKKLRTESLEKKTLSQVAYDNHVSTTTVKAAFNAEIKNRKKDGKFEAHKHMGIDEKNVHTSGGTDTLFVVLLSTKNKSDGTQACGFSALEPIQHTQKAVEKLLMNLDDPDKVETMTMDMCAAYHAAVEAVLPNARIIVDRFHLVKSLNDKTAKVVSLLYASIKTKLNAQLNAFRPEMLLANMLPESEEFAENDALPATSAGELQLLGACETADALQAEVVRKLKVLIENYRNIRFRMNAEYLTPYGKAAMLRLFADFPEFEVIYRIKEEMRTTFFESNTADEARQVADRNEALLPRGKDYYELRTYFKTLNNSIWTPHIYEYFNDPIPYRYSNGAVEAINSYLNEINQMGRGISMDVFRNKILYGHLYAKKHNNRWVCEANEATARYMKFMFEKQTLPQFPFEKFSYVVQTAISDDRIKNSFAGKTEEECLDVLRVDECARETIMMYAEQNLHALNSNNNHSNGDADNGEYVFLTLWLEDLKANWYQYLKLIKEDTDFLERTPNR